MDVDAVSRTIALHGLPTLGYFRLILRELVPCHRWVGRVAVDHLDAPGNRTDVVAEAAPDTIFFSDSRLRAGMDRFILAIRADVVAERLDGCSICADQVDALMRSILASDIAKIALDA